MTHIWVIIAQSWNQTHNIENETVFCSGLKKGMVLIKEKGHFCSRNFVLRALSHMELFSEGAPTHVLCLKCNIRGLSSVTYVCHKIWRLLISFKMIIVQVILKIKGRGGMALGRAAWRNETRAWRRAMLKTLWNDLIIHKSIMSLWVFLWLTFQKRQVLIGWRLISWT